MKLCKRLTNFACCVAAAIFCAFALSGCGLLPAGSGGGAGNGDKAVITVAMLSSEKKSFERLEKAFEENGSPTLRTLFHDLQSTQYINGNCLLLPDAIDLLDKERVELFNK